MRVVPATPSGCAPASTPSLDPDSISNMLTGNDALGDSVDCIDDTGEFLPAGFDVIQNTWTDNLGLDDDPFGLCTDPI